MWLEELHDKRVEVMKVFNIVSEKLNRRLKSLDITVLIDQYSRVIQNIKENINSINNVESDKIKCQLQIESLAQCEKDLVNVSEKCLKLVATCEALDENSLYSDVSMECTLHAYDSLHACTQLQQLVEVKLETISNTIILIDEVNHCLQQLSNIETELSRNKTVEVDEIQNLVKNFISRAQHVIDNSCMENRTARYEVMFIIILNESICKHVIQHNS